MPTLRGADDQRVCLVTKQPEARNSLKDFLVDARVQDWIVVGKVDYLFLRIVYRHYVALSLIGIETP